MRRSLPPICPQEAGACLNGTYATSIHHHADCVYPGSAGRRRAGAHPADGDPSLLAVWKRFWLLPSGMWALVCLPNAFAILAFSEGEGAKALQPIVPPLAYVALWRYFRLRST